MNINASNHECTVLRASTSLIVGPPHNFGETVGSFASNCPKNQKCLVGRDEITVLFLECPSMAPQLALGLSLRRAAGQAPACCHFGHHSPPLPPLFLHFIFKRSFLTLSWPACSSAGWVLRWITPDDTVSSAAWLLAAPWACSAQAVFYLGNNQV